MRPQSGCVTSEQLRHRMFDLLRPLLRFPTRRLLRHTDSRSHLAREVGLDGLDPSPVALEANESILGSMSV